MQESSCRRDRVTFFVVLASVFVANLAYNMLTTALPSVMADFEIDAIAGQLLTTGYVYALGGVSAMIAFFTTRYSIRNLFLVAMAFFIASCVIAVCAQSYPVLLASRFLQACGNGVLIPLVQLVAVAVYPEERRGFALGLSGMVIAFAPVFGPTISGIVTDLLGWRANFVMLACTASVAWVVAFFTIRDIGTHFPVKLDPLSCASFAGGLTCLLVAVSVAEREGLASLGFLLPAAGAVACLALFVVRQLKIPNPLLKLRLFKRKTFALGVILAGLAQIAVLAGPLQASLFMQNECGNMALAVGFVLLPGALANAFANTPAGSFYDRFGMVPCMSVGLSLLAIGSGMFVAFDSSVSVVWVAIAHAIRMIGLAFLVMPTTAYCMTGLDDSETKHATAIINAVRQVVGSLGSNLLIALMAVVTLRWAPADVAAAEGLSLLGFHVSFGLQAVIFAVLIVVVVATIGGSRGKANGASSN